MIANVHSSFAARKSKWRPYMKCWTRYWNVMVKRMQHWIQHLKRKFVYDLDQNSSKINLQISNDRVWVVVTKALLLKLFACLAQLGSTIIGASLTVPLRDSPSGFYPLISISVCDFAYKVSGIKRSTFLTIVGLSIYATVKSHTLSVFHQWCS